MLLALTGVFAATATRADSTPETRDEPGASETQGVTILRRAQALLEPRGKPAVERAVTLSHRWDEAFPATGGTATYRIELPPRQGDAPLALLFSRVGNQVRVSVNGDVRMVRGELGDPQHDAAKTVHLAEIPPELLKTDAANTLEIKTTVQPSRWGGLSTVQYGPAEVLREEFESQRNWRYSSALAFCIAFALMGLMALALWARLRDPLFACFAAASFLGIFRNLDRIWADVPVPWPAWGMVVATAYAWHLALMCLFSLLALNLQRHWAARAVLAYLPLSLMLVVVAFGRPWPLAWTLALAALGPLGLITWVLVLRTAARPGNGYRTTAMVLAVAGGAALLAGAHDLGWVRIGLGERSRYSLTPHAMFFFVVIMAGIIVDRYTRSARHLKALNQTLETRIQAKEQELHQAFDDLEAQRSAQATAAERQRIMRDLHDGVGAQLVGLLNLVKQPGAPPEVLEEQVKAALDEMRLAVDSMQISHGDLTTALATLRYRVQPRLQAAGLTLHWDVQELPVLPALGASAVLQVQRIMLEALTNVLKHAHASAVWVQCEPVPDVSTSGTDTPCGIRLTIADDGKGLPATDTASDGPAGRTGPTPIAAPAGEGLASMRARAKSIGGALEISPRSGGGTQVQLRWPA